MICPSCQKQMTEENFGGVSVDVCESCGGIWFDWMELRRLDEQSEGAGPALEKALKIPLKDQEKRPDIKCPKCQRKMNRHQYQFSKNVQIDECYSCGGIFLDAGELAEIKSGFMSEARRKKFADKLAEKIETYHGKVKDLENRKEKIDHWADLISRINPFD